MWQFDIKTKTFVPGALPADGSQITACYDRLSQEDELEGDSNSILNQRDFLLKYCTDYHFPNPWFFSDDGYTGTNFDRPGFREMMDLVEQGRVSTIIVKDHSWLGRNRLVVGALMERFTDEYSVRYIAVTDGIDSDRGLDDMVAVRELFNEFFPRDTSKKIRAVFTSKGNSGQRLCTQVPYGYIGDKHGWEIDPDAAQVVREIFALCIAGKGPMQIAKHLTAQKVMTPIAYRISQGKQVPHEAPSDPCKWSSNSVVKILERMEYTGCTVNFKTRKKSYKSKRRCISRQRNARFSPIRTRQLLTVKPLTGFRNYASTNAAQPRQESKGFSPGCCTVPTAAQSSISALQTASRQTKNTMYVPTTRATRELAPLTSFGKWSCMILYWTICGKQFSLSVDMKLILSRPLQIRAWQIRKKNWQNSGGNWHKLNGALRNWTHFSSVCTRTIFRAG